MKYFFTFIFLLTIAFPASAATLYLEPEQATYGLGDSFKVAIKIDVEECVNTVSAGIKFPQELLKAVDFLNGESILSIWIESPKKADLEEINQSGVIRFAGGIPGGYCGMIPGDPGDSNKIGEVVFSLPSMLFGEIPQNEVAIELLPDSRVMLNDGLGTQDQTVLKNSLIRVLGNSTGSVMEGKSVINSDNIRPEPFIVELYNNTRLFQGQSYIIFSTVDKQSGIDHYEVMEEPLENEEKEGWLGMFFEKERPEPQWHTASTPYLLKDQTLQSKIKVKALDRNNNERVVEFIPPQEARQERENSYERELTLLLVSIFLIIVLSLVLFIIIKKHLRNKHHHAYDQDNQSGPEPGL